MNCVGPTGTNNPNNAKPRSLTIPGAYNEVGPPSTVDLHYNKGVERVTFGNKSTFFTLKKWVGTVHKSSALLFCGSMQFGCSCSYFFFVASRPLFCDIKKITARNKN